MSEDRRAIDVSGLPSFAVGARDPVWWGVVMLLAIEGMMFLLLGVSYFYIRGTQRLWPPAEVGQAATLFALAGATLSILSSLPMVVVERAARRGSLRGMRAGLNLATVLGLLALVCRALELHALPFRWDSHSFGSVVYTALGLHTLHAITDLLENGMLITLLYRGPVEKKHLVDVQVNCLYWWFVTGFWVLVTAVIYGDAQLFGGWSVG